MTLYVPGSSVLTTVHSASVLATSDLRSAMHVTEQGSQFSSVILTVMVEVQPTSSDCFSSRVHLNVAGSGHSGSGPPCGVCEEDCIYTESERLGSNRATTHCVIPYILIPRFCSIN